ncbi:protein beta [Pandoraea fibrosis]|uniref:Protein beta n=1 Tax=Pandoraea fibrosis TaxID=1891094 RepID=A0ABX6HNS7_9BURK|nr:beta family protein [Pandoraea fibrosis]QHE94261.1 protein beta [Pandoraea fibrosis]QHF12175.1 protein beta [Pandoraea fibrosis]
MSKSIFSDFRYFPILRTRQAELAGFSKLSDDQKDQILPLITLGKWRNTDGVEKALEKVEQCLGKRQYMLDLSKDGQHQNDAVRDLMNPEKGFANWLAFVNQRPEVVPVVQLSPDARVRDIVKQAQGLERSGKDPVFRVRNYQSDLDHTLTALYALDAPENALVVLDAGYIRDISTKRIKSGVLESVLRSINRIVEEVPEVARVLAGTSYPRSVTQFLHKGSETSGKIDMLEHVLYEEIGPDIVMYGDHASIHSVVYDDEGGTFLPRLDVPWDHSWTFERRPGRKGDGYAEIATKLLDDHPDLQTNPCWGAQMIRNTANGTGETINGAVTAISVRVNLHITYQLSVFGARTNQSGEEDDWL